MQSLLQDNEPDCGTDCLLDEGVDVASRLVVGAQEVGQQLLDHRHIPLHYIFK